MTQQRAFAINKALKMIEFIDLVIIEIIIIHNIF